MISTRGRAGLLIAIIATGSALAGAAIERVVVQRYLRHRAPGFRGSPETDARRRVETLDKLAKDLSLTPAQRSGLDSVMQRTDSLLRGIRVEMQPRIARAFDDSRAEMMTRLTPDQQAKFREAMPGHNRRGLPDGGSPVR